MTDHTLPSMPRHPEPILQDVENDGRQVDGDEEAAKAVAAVGETADPEKAANPDSIPDRNPDRNPDLPLTDLARGLVGWDGVDDPANPRNWPAWKKRYLMVVMGVMSTLV